MINAGTDPIAAIMLGPMGIKTALIGGEQIYDRTGSFIYIQLSTQTEKENENG